MTLSEAIARLEAFTQHAENVFRTRGSLIFCAGKTLRPAVLRSLLAALENPPKHDFWCAGEPDCPRDIKAFNGELHTLRCKRCGLDSPRSEICTAEAMADRPTLPKDPSHEA